jgi:two-component system, sensor histidine kinase and response regulator
MPTRVLVVEDSATQAEAIRALLEGAGYEVAAAASGEDGLAAFNGRKCDVVISDIVMPGSMDGYELCRRIKATDRRETPVVLLTSLADPLDIIRGLECGADHFLTKPYESDHLLERLKTLLATRETRSRAKVRMGVRVFFLGREFTITSEREQILDLLISTFEDAVRQNRELREREKMLDATNTELEAFMYGISHDLRGPLRHVEGFSKMLLDDFSPQLDAAAQGYLNRIRQGVENMGRMVDSLLDLGRLGRRDVKVQPTDLRPLVEAAMAELETQTRGRRVEWRIGLLAPVACDRELMESVLSNLLSNAVKYTRGRDPAVIEVGQTSIGSQTVMFVRDNGAGFDMRYADKLFGIFQRLHHADEFEGTGVGLATVQRIIHKHGGRVWAEAELGKGAAFYWTLPVPGTGKAEDRAAATRRGGT